MCVGAFRIFGDKIPAFTWMDGGSPSEGGFYAVEFPTPKDIRRSLLWGCGSASFTVLPKLESNITDAFQKYFIQQISGSEIEKRNVYFQEMPKSGRGLYPNGFALFFYQVMDRLGPCTPLIICNAKICSVLDLHLAAMAI